MFDAPQDDPIQAEPLFNPLEFRLQAYINATSNTKTVTLFTSAEGLNEQLRLPKQLTRGAFSFLQRSRN